MKNTLQRAGICVPGLFAFLRCFVALIAGSVHAGALSAQDAGRSRAQISGEERVDLKILRTVPSDSGVPGSIIAITFDHTIGGLGTAALEATRVMSITPAVEGAFEWFDDRTIRFLPRNVIAPGSSFVVSLDTATIASEGKRSAPRYVFPVSFRGARPLAMVVEGKAPTADWALGPIPTFRVLYSTTVNIDSVAGHSRLVFTPECGGTISLKMKTLRAVAATDEKIIVNAGGLGRDTTIDRFRTVVEMQPTDSLRPNCLGVWHVASFDPMRPMDGWAYGVRTAPPFAIKAVHPCVLTNPRNTLTVCEPDGFSVVFSAEVSHSEFARALHVSPSISPIVPHAGVATIFTMPVELTPHQQYTVTIDSTLRDTYGRRLSGPNTFTVTANDRAFDLLETANVLGWSGANASTRPSFRQTIPRLALHPVWPAGTTSSTIVFSTPDL